MDKNSVLTGFVLGAIVPVIGYVIITFLFDLLTQTGLMDEVSASTSDKRYRTILLLSLCMSLIPFQLGKKYRWDDTMRGIVIPTMVYVGAWVYMFAGGLF